MSTPVIRQAVAASVENAVATVTLGAGTAVGDLLLIFHGNDFYTAAGLPTPTSSQALSGLTLRGTADQGASQAHVKFWTAVTTVAGTQTGSGNRVTDEEVSLHVIVLDGSTVNTASFIDGTVATGGATASTTAMVAPAVSPSTADALLVSMVQTNGAASATPSFTQPSGMTERTDVADGFFTGSSTASLVLSASGTTGTKTFTCTATQGYATVSVAVKGGVTGLAIDASSPATALNSAVSAPTVASASFTPPANSLLVVLWAGNTQDSIVPGSPSITDNLGVHLPFTLQQFERFGQTFVANAQAAIWTAPVTTSAAMTVTVSTGTAVDHMQSELRVIVPTDTTQPTGGASNKNGQQFVSTTVPMAYPAARNGSGGFSVVSDWDPQGNETAGAGTTLIDSQTIGTAMSAGFFRRTTADGVAAAATTLNATLPAQSAHIQWAAVEILPAGSAGGVVEGFVPHRSGRRTARTRFRAYQPTRRTAFEAEQGGVPAVSAFADVATAAADVTLGASTALEVTGGGATSASSALDTAGAAGVAADVAVSAGAAFDASAAAGISADVAVSASSAGDTPSAGQVNAHGATAGAAGLRAGLAGGALGPAGGRAPAGGAGRPGRGARGS